jgi:hypothetical protein
MNEILGLGFGFGSEPGENRSREFRDSNLVLLVEEPVSNLRRRNEVRIDTLIATDPDSQLVLGRRDLQAHRLLKSSNSLAAAEGCLETDSLLIIAQVVLLWMSADQSQESPLRTITSSLKSNVVRLESTMNRLVTACSSVC